MISKNRKRSLGDLRRCSPTTKPKSPTMLGRMHLQRSTLKTLTEQLEESGCDEIICNLAAWQNLGETGPFITVELSPRYAKKAPLQRTGRFFELFISEEPHETVSERKPT